MHRTDVTLVPSTYTQPSVAINSRKFAIVLKSSTSTETTLSSCSSASAPMENQQLDSQLREIFIPTKTTQSATINSYHYHKASRGNLYDEKSHLMQHFTSAHSQSHISNADLNINGEYFDLVAKQDTDSTRPIVSENKGHLRKSTTPVGVTSHGRINYETNGKSIARYRVYVANVNSSAISKSMEKKSKLKEPKENCIALNTTLNNLKPLHVKCVDNLDQDLVRLHVGLKKLFNKT